MHKSGRILILKDEKSGKVIYEITGRCSKIIKLFLIHTIKEKWVLKSDIFSIVKNTMQFENIWEYFKAKEKSRKEDEEDGN